jgi:hypothetical protein
MTSKQRQRLRAGARHGSSGDLGGREPTRYDKLCHKYNESDKGHGVAAAARLKMAYNLFMVKNSVVLSAE